ncbi:MAG: TonB-dependent receptor plug domain-containing protein, partial [bacterium]
MNKQIVAGSVAAVLALSVQMPTVADERKMALQEVIVTARKKEERIQDAPLSVSAVNTETIEASFLGDTRQLAQYSPNMVFDEIPSGTPRGGGISIRGISLQDVEKTFDPTVLIHVDGVPLGTNTANVLNMLDIERVEVLRGPQGTLFGKNAVGGVINIWRKKPILGQWAGKALVRYDNQDGSNVEGVINVPLGETLAAKINVGREELPGYYENITTGDDEGDSVEKKWGVHLLWQPTDTLTLEAQYNDSDMDGHIAPHLNISNEMTVLCAGFGTCAQSDDTPLSGDRRKGAGNREQSFDLETSDYQFNVNWEISDELTGVLIAGHRELKEDAYYDIDGSELTLFHVRRPNEYEQDSLEARVDYTSTDRFSFSAGYYYWNAKLKDWANEVEIPIFLGLDEDACGFGMIPCQLERASAE